MGIDVIDHDEYGKKMQKIIRVINEFFEREKLNNMEKLWIVECIKQDIFNIEELEVWKFKDLFTKKYL